MQIKRQLHLPYLSVVYTFSDEEMQELHILTAQGTVKESQLRFGEIFYRLGLVDEISRDGDLWWKASDLLMLGQDAWAE